MIICGIMRDFLVALCMKIGLLLSVWLMDEVPSDGLA